jgi:hypothetical protein
VASSSLYPENTEERLIWYALLGTYPLYAIGALYIIGPVLAWVLLVRLGMRLWTQSFHAPSAAGIRVAPAVWLWCAGMLFMLVALVAGHLSQDLGIAKLMKSSIGWAKGWALLAVFPLAGCLPVRPELLYRGACIVCLHTLLLSPIFFGAWVIGLPETLWVSPLKVVGGPGPEFFSLSLYEIDPGRGTPRWRLFTPWAPAVGFVANVYFVFALNERDRRWKAAGIAGSVMMVLMSQSRLAIVCMAFIPLAAWTLSKLHRPGMWMAAGVAVSVLGILATPLLALFDDLVQAFKSARSGSTRVRAALARIAIERWQTEAPVWGHGIVERGPHLVEFMPIGSHHTWYGLLFVKGAVGFIALALPLAWSFLELLAKAQGSSLARAGLAMVLIIFLYTFGENLEILAYLFWPALILLGLSLNAQSQNSPVEARPNLNEETE